MNDSFVFYRSFIEGIKRLPESERLKAYDAIVEYALDDKPPEGDGLFAIVYEMAKPQIDANKQRKEISKKGGAPKGNTNAKTAKNNSKQPTVEFEETKKQPNVNVNVNGNVNENENVNVNVNANENVSNRVTQVKEKINKKETRFTPPTVDEVREYCGERGLTVNAESFVDFYSSKNWYVGKNKMVDWHAACRNWSRNERKDNQRSGKALNDYMLNIINGGG